MSFEMNQPQNQNFFGLFSAINLSFSPFWAFLQIKMADFPTLSFTSTSEILEAVDL